MLAPIRTVAGATPDRVPFHTPSSTAEVALARAPAADCADSARDCFHCGRPNPRAPRWQASFDGIERSFCCAGCLGIARAIRAAGLQDFYRHREAAAGAAAGDAGSDEDCARDADRAEAAGLVMRLEGDLREASLLVEGMHCGSCLWLIERYLARQPGMTCTSVNLATRRARVRWDAGRATLADALRALTAIGYRARPYDPARREEAMRRESRALLRRAALALLAMMQVMMFAVPAYVSDAGVEPEYRTLFDWASLLLSLPVVLYSASPFFAGAWRDLRRLRLGMDVPVALGIAGAFAASAWSTLSGEGVVYYDSLTMFVALLLVARLFEFRARRSAGDAIEAFAHELPPTAERLHDAAPERTETVAAHNLRPGDRIRIAAGAPVPADGEIVSGRSSVEESVLTGESRPRTRTVGDRVLAGSINRESPLVVRVDAAGEATTLAALARLVERAAGERPRLARIADRVAAWFVAGLLAIAAATAAAWWPAGPAQALLVTLAVLVVSCPCALSLATPVALAAAAGAAGRRRVFTVRAGAAESLARVTHVVFDKTGTLTQGRLSLAGVVPLASEDGAACVALAAALEGGSAHPIAQALRGAAPSAPTASDIVASPGNGVEGVVGTRRCRIGRPAWVAAMHGRPPPAAANRVPPDAVEIALGDATGWLAWFTFADALRPGARELVTMLQSMGIAVSLLSGDRSATVRHVAHAAGIATQRGDAQPEDKRAAIAALQRDGAIVAMVGDGVNDAPSLAQANVSLAFGSASALTRWTADVVVLDDDLAQIAEAIARARRTDRVIRQNLAWAFAYNALAIPLAATGQLTPLAAAIGMSLSSLLVVANAARLLRERASPARDTIPARTALATPT
jgi:Cu2+-exporting ATPase